MFVKPILTFENGLVVGKNGDIKAPVSTYKVDTGDIDLASKRSTSGYLNRNRIRGGENAVYTVTIAFQRISWDELVKLIQAGNAAQFQLTVLDPRGLGGYVTKTMMRDANMSYELRNIDGDDEAYWSTSMSFVEF